MTVEQIKALPRTQEGVFDLKGLGGNPYKAALAVYPVYAEYESEVNGKAGYPDIMAQMRYWNQRVQGEFSFENASDYIVMLYATIEMMSPQIYEYYRELTDMLRDTVKRVLAENYSTDERRFSDSVSGTEYLTAFCNTVKKAADNHLLLAEKYQMCIQEVK